MVTFGRFECAQAQGTAGDGRSLLPPALPPGGTRTLQSGGSLVAGRSAVRPETAACPVNNRSRLRAIWGGHSTWRAVSKSPVAGLPCLCCLHSSQAAGCLLESFHHFLSALKMPFGHDFLKKLLQEVPDQREARGPPAGAQVQCPWRVVFLAVHDGTFQRTFCSQDVVPCCWWQMRSAPGCPLLLRPWVLHGRKPQTGGTACLMSEVAGQPVQGRQLGPVCRPFR